MNNKYIWVIVLIILATAALFACRPRPRSNVDGAVDAIKNTVEQSQQRADTIVASTKTKEVAAREESRKNTRLMSDDELLSAINEMLSQYRAGN